MGVAVIVPRTPGQPARDAAWSWVRARYLERHPDYELVEAHGPAEPWVKANLVNPAVAATTADIVVVADADCWTDHLELAVAAVERGYPWAIPHRRVHRLTEAATELVLAGGRLDRHLELDEPPYVGCPAGGIFAARRDVLLDVPLDPRFVGWGGEDRSHGWALRILYGGPWRHDGPLWHLWHPPQPRQSRNVGTAANHELRARYESVRRDAAAMRRLLEEVTPS